MDRKLRIFFTSDCHGYFAPTDYAKNCRAATGLANCAANFADDGNTLVIDGGDTLQGSPFTYWLYSRTGEKSLVPARVMNLAGYDFITLGNHDFNYGVKELERYLAALDARCLCANVQGLRGVRKTAVVTMANGLRVGLTGVTSHFIPRWEKPENIEGLTITDAFEAARDALEELRAQDVDLTLCIYHGGFENDVETGVVLSDTTENQGWQMCRELDFDVLLTGHQHMPVEDQCIFGTFTCQPPDKARQYARVDVTVDGAGKVQAVSRLMPAGEKTQPEISAFLEPLERETAAFLDTPLGHLDTALTPDTPLNMALHGSLIANFFNQVQREASGAELSATCLANEVRGFSEDVTVRDIVATYVFPNTLKTIRVDRAVLKAALERSAEYFALDAEGRPCVSESFLKPLIQHYNFDYLSGVEADVDLKRAPGDRVISIRVGGRELDAGRRLTLCLNNYRASGAGGYGFYAKCETVREQPEEISELIIGYVDRHREITVDRTKWLHVTNRIKENKMNNKVFKVVLLQALPASGKSEVRNFMAHVEADRLRDEFHIGANLQLDDFPYVHMMRRIDNELEAMGEARIFYPGEEPFTDGRDWGTLCMLLNEDYHDLMNRTRVCPDSAARYLFERIDRAGAAAGIAPRMGLLKEEIRAKLAAILEKEARDMLDEKQSAYPDSFEDKTVVIECARGGPDGSAMPLTGTFGYQYSLPMFCPEILENAAILYIWVTPEESRRKNADRADPNDPGSNLHHGVPMAVMLGDYGCDDMEYLREHSKANCVSFDAHGRHWDVPIGVFDNRVDKTSFLRAEPEEWDKDKVEVVTKAIRAATDAMFENYKK